MKRALKIVLLLLFISACKKGDLIQSDQNFSDSIKAEMNFLRISPEIPDINIVHLSVAPSGVILLVSDEGELIKYSNEQMEFVLLPNGFVRSVFFNDEEEFVVLCDHSIYVMNEEVEIIEEYPNSHGVPGRIYPQLEGDYLAHFDHDIFKSTDMGRTWEYYAHANRGLSLLSQNGLWYRIFWFYSSNIGGRPLFTNEISADLGDNWSGYKNFAPQIEHNGKSAALIIDNSISIITNGEQKFYHAVTESSEIHLIDLQFKQVDYGDFNGFVTIVPPICVDDEGYLYMVGENASVYRSAEVQL